MYQLETSAAPPETASWNLVKDQRFVYDGWNMIAELDHTTATSTGLAGSGVSRTFQWGPDLSGTMSGAGGVGGLLSLTKGGVMYAVCSDANGNVTGLVPTSGPGAGQLIARYDYDPFGNRITDTGPAGEICPFGFSSKYRDEETGMLYYGYRYYSPELGRWLNRDPIGEEGGINLYGMVGNDPVNRVDVLGLSEIVIAMNRFSDDQIRSLGYRPDSAVLGGFTMTVQNHSGQRSDYPELLSGVTIEQPRGSRNLYGLFGKSKEYPIPSGSYAVAYSPNAPGGTEGFKLTQNPLGFTGVYIHTGNSAGSSEGCIIIGSSHLQGTFYDKNILADPNSAETQGRVKNGSLYPFPSSKFPNRHLESSGPDASGVTGSVEKLASMVEFYKRVECLDKAANASTTIKIKISNSVPKAIPVP